MCTQQEIELNEKKFHVGILWWHRREITADVASWLRGTARQLCASWLNAMAQQQAVRGAFLSSWPRRVAVLFLFCQLRRSDWKNKNNKKSLERPCWIKLHKQFKFIGSDLNYQEVVVLQHDVNNRFIFRCRFVDFMNGFMWPLPPAELRLMYGYYYDYYTVLEDKM